MSVEEKTGPVESPGIEYPEFVTLADSARGTGAKPVRFDAVLQPHTTLGPRSFLLFMAVFGTVSFIAGVSFILVGSWPVYGFAALDVLLVYYVYRMNFYASRRYETIQLTADSLTVLRVSPRGKRRRIRFQPYWLQIQMDDPPQPDSALVLRSHGRELEIGKFLTPEEKLDLAVALSAELEQLNAAPGAH
jgi:uncharacterized membrane protein